MVRQWFPYFYLLLLGSVSNFRNAWFVGEHSIESQIRFVTKLEALPLNLYRRANIIQVRLNPSLIHFLLRCKALLMGTAHFISGGDHFIMTFYLTQLLFELTFVHCHAGNPPRGLSLWAFCFRLAAWFALIISPVHDVKIGNHRRVNLADDCSSLALGIYFGTLVVVSVQWIRLKVRSWIQYRAITNGHWIQSRMAYVFWQICKWQIDRSFLLSLFLHLRTQEHTLIIIRQGQVLVSKYLKHRGLNLLGLFWLLISELQDLDHCLCFPLIVICFLRILLTIGLFFSK